MGEWYTSRFTGLFSNFGPVPLAPQDPDISVIGGAVIPFGSRTGSILVGGADWSERGAIGAATGEAIERFQPYPMPQDGTLVSSYDRWPLAENAAAPGIWALFLPEQYVQDGFPFQPLSTSTECRWTCFRDAFSGKPVWIPEELGYLYPRPGAVHRICPGISTGLSCGLSQDPVLLRGLQEVIERDAILGAWWGTYRLEEWDFPDFEAPLRNRIVRPNLTYHFYRVDSPFSAHVTIATAQGLDADGFLFSVGSACRETRKESWNKSTLEALHGRHYVRYLRTTGVAEDSGSPIDFQQHALYYSFHPEALCAGAFHRAQQAAPDPERDRVEPLLALHERLGSQHPVLFRNMTAPGIAQEIRDWYVLKVVVPGLQPLHGNHHFPHLGGQAWSRPFSDWPSMPPHPFA